MQLHTTVPPYHLPEADQQSVMRLGLQPLDMARWMHPDADFQQFHQHKTHTLQRYPGRGFVELEESRDAQREFSALLLQNLLEHHPKYFELRTGKLVHSPSGINSDAADLGLANSQYWVQEDICLLQPVSDEYQLTAASVCSPSNWALEKKIGKSVDQIHSPVPGYQQVLAERVNRLLRGLKCSKPMLRFNWSLQQGNELFWRKDLNAAAGDAETYWRVERQTLVKLPESGAVVFGIRIFLHPLASLGDSRNTIAAVVERLPSAERIYKGLK